MRAIELCAVLPLLLAGCRAKDAAKEVLPVERLGADRLRLSDDALKNLELAKVRSGDFSDRLSVMGRIAVVEDRMSVVSARVGGRIDAVYVASGEQMEPGQPMASFFSPDYAVARDEFLQAKKQAAGVTFSGDGATMLDLARRKLVAIGMAPSDIDQLDRSTETSVSSLLIRAPRPGVLLNKNAIVGNVNNVGDTLFTVGNIDEVWFNGDIYPEDLHKVRKGQEVLISPREAGVPVRGTVSFVSPVIDATARTIKIRVLMRNPDHLLLPDMYVNGNIVLSRHASLQIPRKALIRLRDQTFCFKRDGGSEFRRVPIEVGGEQDGVVAVLKGLAAGDEVVSEGALLLDQSLNSADSAN